MKKIIYKFNDGTSNAVEVTDEFYSLYMEMEKEDKKSDRRETRRHQSLDKSMDGGFEIIDTSPNPEQLLEENEIKNMLGKCLDKLTDKQRMILILHAEQELSFTQIGIKIGISKDTVKEHYWAAIKKIRKIFTEIPPQNGFFVATKCRHNKPNTYKEEQ